MNCDKPSWLVIALATTAAIVCFSGKPPPGGGGLSELFSAAHKRGAAWTTKASETTAFMFRGQDADLRTERRSLPAGYTQKL